MSDKFARWATALAVLAVAVIAAIVSYTHIQTLALSHGYTPGTAGLLPFSVDGLIVASSLALANGARAWLARTGLVLGVLATVAANILYGARFGLVGAVVSAWPAVAFLVSSEILVGMLRDRADDEAVNVAQDNEDANEAGLTEDEAPTPIPVASDQTDEDEATPPVLPMPRGKAPKTTRTRTRTRKAAPERVFAAEIAAGKVPTIRAIKEGCHVGTDNARVIREQLLGLVGHEVPQAA